MPWLIIILGVLAALCLCAIVIGIAILAFFTPIRASTTPVTVTEVVTEQESTLPTTVPSPESADPSFAEAAPAGSPVDIGNNMVLIVLDVTRPVDDIVASGSVLNTTPPEGEEFMQVDMEVTCSSAPGTKCTFYPTVMKAALSDGSTRDLQTFIEGVDDWNTAVEIEGGAIEQGFLLFIVPKSETDLVISYQDISADQPLYMQLP
jgi:hypothetical protein